MATAQRNHNTNDDISQTARSAYRSIKESGKRAKSEIEDMMDETTNSAEELAHQAGQVLNQAYQQSRAKIDETAERAREVVTNRPLTTLVGAFVVGAVASMLLRRR